MTHGYTTAMPGILRHLATFTDFEPAVIKPGLFVISKWVHAWAGQRSPAYYAMTKYVCVVPEVWKTKEAVTFIDKIKGDNQKQDLFISLYLLHKAVKVKKK